VIRISLSLRPGAQLPGTGIATITVNLDGNSETLAVDLATTGRYNHLWDQFPELARTFARSATVTGCVINNITRDNCLRLDAEQVIANPNQNGVAVFTYFATIGSNQRANGPVPNVAFLSSGPSSTATVRFPGPIPTTTTRMTRTGMQVTGGIVGVLLLGAGVLLVCGKRRRSSA
jgi:hypothetical protein